MGKTPGGPTHRSCRPILFVNRFFGPFDELRAAPQNDGRRNPAKPKGRPTAVRDREGLLPLPLDQDEDPRHQGNQGDDDPKAQAQAGKSVQDQKNPEQEKSDVACDAHEGLH